MAHLDLPILEPINTATVKRQGSKQGFTLRDDYTDKQVLAAYRKGFKISANMDASLDTIDANFSGKLWEAAHDGYMDYAIDKPFGSAWFEETCKED